MDRVVNNGKITWNTEIRRLGDLIPWEDNPRQLTKDQAERLERSLKKFGYSQLVEIEPDDTFLDGHQRDDLMKIMTEFGPDAQIECRVANRKFTLDERKEYIGLKHQGATGEWNWEQMHNLYEFDELIDYGFEAAQLEAFGFMAEEEILDDPGAQIDRAEELREKWGVESGQLWRLGDHRLIVGDCTDAEIVERVMDGEQYSVLTDPPYNIGFNYESIDDKMTKENYAEFCHQWFEIVVPNSKGTIFSPGPHNERYYPIPRDRGFWVKRNATAGASCFHLRLVEPLLFYGKFESKRNTDVFEYSSGFSAELTAAQRAAGVADNHPPAKSVPLWEELLSMLVGDMVVLDVFLGNGTTLIACERLGRKCRAVEISPAYCAVAIQRWVDMTGQEPELVDS